MKRVNSAYENEVIRQERSDEKKEDYSQSQPLGREFGVLDLDILRGSELCKNISVKVPLGEDRRNAVNPMINVPPEELLGEQIISRKFKRL